MIRKILVPFGWPCTLREARPGPFLVLGRENLLCFKSEYSDNDGKIHAYNSAGEFLHGPADELVQPVDMQTEIVE